jgi:hypothetical protein
LLGVELVFRHQQRLRAAFQQEINRLYIVAEAGEKA